MTEKYSNLFTKLSNISEDDSFIWEDCNSIYNNFNIGKNHHQELISLATDLELFWSEENDKSFVPIHAWRIIGNLSITEAATPLINRFDDYHESDWGFEELPLVFEKIGINSVEGLKKHLYDTSKEEFSRVLAGRCLLHIGCKYSDKKDQCINILADCLDNHNDDVEFAALNGLIIAYLIELNAKSKIENIRKAFEKDVVDPSIAGDLEDVEITLGLRMTRDTPQQRYGILKYIHDSLENFNANTNQHSKKLGRNNPCHCGSGKKYKKCCLDKELLT